MRKPYIISIAGPSCSGKSTLARSLAQHLTTRSVTLLCLDDYYKDLSALEPAERALINFDVPDAFEHELFATHLQALANGKSIDRPKYDFAHHVRCSQTVPISPAEFVVIEGLFALHWPTVNQMVDARVFVDLDLDVCLRRRIERDIRERARTPESIVAQWETVLPMCQQYVMPTAQHCDLKVNGEEAVDLNTEMILRHIQSVL